MVVDGALLVRAVPGADVTIKGLRVMNAGWRWQALEEGEVATEEERIRSAGCCVGGGGGGSLGVCGSGGEGSG